MIHNVSINDHLRFFWWYPVGIHMSNNNNNNWLFSIAVLCGLLVGLIVVSSLISALGHAIRHNSGAVVFWAAVIGFVSYKLWKWTNER